MLHGICESGCLHTGLIIQLVTGLPLLQHCLHRGSELVDLRQSGNPDSVALSQSLMLFPATNSVSKGLLELNISYKWINIWAFYKDWLLLIRF